MRLSQIAIPSKIEDIYTNIAKVCDKFIDSKFIAGVDYKISLIQSGSYRCKESQYILEVEVYEGEESKKITYTYEFGKFIVIEEYTKDEDDAEYCFSDSLVIDFNEFTNANDLSQSGIKWVTDCVDYFEDKAHDRDIEEENDSLFIERRYEESFDGLID